MNPECTHSQEDSKIHTIREHKDGNIGYFLRECTVDGCQAPLSTFEDEHKYGEAELRVEEHKNRCEDGGDMVVSCTICGFVAESTPVPPQEEDGEDGVHTVKEWETTKAPGQIGISGEKEGMCSVCNTCVKIEIAGSHEYTEYTLKLADGQKDIVSNESRNEVKFVLINSCKYSDCDAILTKDLECLDLKKTSVEPTCTETGSDTYEYFVDGESKASVTVEVDKLQHAYSWNNENGEETKFYFSDVPEEAKYIVDSDILEKLNEFYDISCDDFTEISKLKCNMCQNGYPVQVKKDHKYEYDLSVSEENEKTFKVTILRCADCDEKFNEEVELDSSDVGEAEKVEATCTSVGYTIYCYRYNGTYLTCKVEADKLAHQLNGAEIDTNEVYTFGDLDGLVKFDNVNIDCSDPDEVNAYFVCDVCKDDVYVKAREPHSYTVFDYNDDEKTLVISCSECEKESERLTEAIRVEKVEPTCAESGKILYSGKDSEGKLRNVTETIPKVDHKMPEGKKEIDGEYYYLYDENTMKLSSAGEISPGETKKAIYTCPVCGGRMSIDVYLPESEPETEPETEPES